MDLNKDGFIDAEELKKVMKNLGMKHSDEEISLMMQHADINGKTKNLPIFGIFILGNIRNYIVCGLHLFFWTFRAYLFTI